MEASAVDSVHPRQRRSQFFSPPGLISPPVPLEHERAPIGGIAEAVLSRESEAGLAERRSGPQVFFPKAAVEGRHQLGRGPVVDPPEARDDARRSRVQQELPERIEDPAAIAAILRGTPAPPSPGESTTHKRKPAA